MSYGGIFMAPEYKKQENLRLKNKAYNYFKENLPEFSMDYIDASIEYLSGNTLLSYAYELNVFFNWLVSNHSLFENKSIKNIELKVLDKITAIDIDKFFKWLATHQEVRADSKKEMVSHTNSSRMKYLYCLKSFWKFYIDRNMLSQSPLTVVRIQKEKKDGPVIKMNANEQSRFLEAITYGSGLTEKQLKFHEKTYSRDMAIFTLFLHTGLRISEVRGINTSDINFDEHYIAVYRKGSKYDEVYISDMCEEYIKEYLQVRELFKPSAEAGDALFLSLKGNRISIRQIQVMMKKYVGTSVPVKKDILTPHKLRSSYATSMLEITDIRTVQELLAHENIQTTTIYADSSVNKKDLRNAMQPD